MTPILRELWLLAKDRPIRYLLILACALSTLTVTSGVLEARRQNLELDTLVEADRAERTQATLAQSDWGSVAYYSFHVLYDRPDALSFLTMGQRELAPWKYRIRALALEGQIYESDTTHPELSLTGRFDFAFLVGVIAPLFLILMIYDVRGSERSAGRYELISVHAGGSGSVWYLRTLLRTVLLTAAVCAPMLIAGVLLGVSIVATLHAALIALVSLVVWACIGFAIDARNIASPVKLTSLLGIWLLLSVLLPAALKTIIERQHPTPDAAGILLTQREAVNDAWDIPKADTMRKFLQKYPGWTRDALVTQPFEWKWYYAFQHVGDLSVAAASDAYRQARLDREHAIARLAWLSPTTWAQRRLQRLANTDVTANLAFEQRVRDFHRALRHFYYPKLFRNEVVTPEAIAERPEFTDTWRPDADANKPIDPA